MPNNEPQWVVISDDHVIELSARVVVLGVRVFEAV